MTRLVLDNLTYLITVWPTSMFTWCFKFNQRNIINLSFTNAYGYCNFKIYRFHKNNFKIEIAKNADSRKILSSIFSESWLFWQATSQVKMGFRSVVQCSRSQVDSREHFFEDAAKSWKWVVFPKIARFLNKFECYINRNKGGSQGSDSRWADHKSFIAGSNQMDHFKNIKIINLTFARIYSKSLKIIQNPIGHDFKEN